jgi:hypothetical protein
VERLAMLAKPSIMFIIVEKVAKSGEKWGKLWITMAWGLDVLRQIRAFGR